MSGHLKSQFGNFRSTHIFISIYWYVMFQDLEFLWFSNFLLFSNFQNIVIFMMLIPNELYVSGEVTENND